MVGVKLPKHEHFVIAADTELYVPVGWDEEGGFVEPQTKEYWDNFKPPSDINAFYDAFEWKQMRIEEVDIRSLPR